MQTSKQDAIFEDKRHVKSEKGSFFILKCQMMNAGGFHKSLIFCCSDLRRFLSLSVLMFMADFLSFLCSRQAGVLFYLFMAGGFFLFIVHDRISCCLLFMTWGNFLVFIVPGRVRFLSFYCSWQEDGRIAWPAVWLNSIVHFCHCEFFLLANDFFTSYIFINSF